MKKFTLKSFFDSALDNSDVKYKGMLFSLCISGLITSAVFIFMVGLWFEFSTVNHGVFFYVDRSLGYDELTILSIMKTSELFNVDDVLLLFSSRDSSSLLSVFSLWRISLYGLLGMTLYWVVICLYQKKSKQPYKYKLIALFTGCVCIYVGAKFVHQTIPHQLDGFYLLQIMISLFLILTAYMAVSYLQKRAVLNSQHLASKKTTLIAYASQSGTAKSVALKMAKSPQINCDIRDFSQLTPQCLLSYNQLLVVASTYGEGQAPEKSVNFSKALSLWKEQLSHLSYAVLALGDRAYPHFCAFGHQIDTLLNNKGAIAMRPIQEINRGDPLIITNWWESIGELLSWKIPNVTYDIKHDFMDGTIVSNDCLNAVKPMRPAHAITISTKEINYQAGDLLEVLTPMSISTIDEKLELLGLLPRTTVVLNKKQYPLNKALTQLEWTNQVASSAQALVDKLSSIRPRVYSIASAPNDPNIRLLVRSLKKDDGSVGFSSSTLCNALPKESFQVAIREHDSFRLPKKDDPIIMIAAGTGIAPFMSFLAQRNLQNNHENWLIFGEQYSRHDNYFNHELDDYLESGVLSQLDYAFSRDTTWLEAGKPRYVGDIINLQSQKLSDWLLNKGAHLYVCGNKNGMGDSVILAFKNLLAQDYDQLEQANRLHFDLY